MNKTEKKEGLVRLFEIAGQKKGLYAHLWEIQENSSGWKLR